MRFHPRLRAPANASNLETREGISYFGDIQAGRNERHFGTYDWFGASEQAVPDAQRIENDDGNKNEKSGANGGIQPVVEGDFRVCGQRGMGKET